MRRAPRHDSARGRFQDGGILTGGLALELAGEVKPLMVFAARRGFRGMTVPFMTKLAKELGISSPPRLEQRLVSALVAKLLRRDISPDELVGMMRWRGKEVSSLDAESMLKDPENLSELKDALVADEACEDFATELAERIKVAKARVSEKLAAASSSRASSSRDALVAFAEPDGERAARASTWGEQRCDRRDPAGTLPATHDVDLEVARGLMPARVGAVLHKDLTRHSRWHATFRRSGTHVVTKTFGRNTGLTERAALVFVLRQVWLWEEEAGGGVGPYVLDM